MMATSRARVFRRPGNRCALQSEHLKTKTSKNPQPQRQSGQEALSSHSGVAAGRGVGHLEAQGWVARGPHAFLRHCWVESREMLPSLCSGVLTSPRSLGFTLPNLIFLPCLSVFNSSS